MFSSYIASPSLRQERKTRMNRNVNNALPPLLWDKGLMKPSSLENKSVTEKFLGIFHNSYSAPAWVTRWYFSNFYHKNLIESLVVKPRKMSRNFLTESHTNHSFFSNSSKSLFKYVYQFMAPASAAFALGKQSQLWISGFASGNFFLWLV